MKLHLPKLLLTAVLAVVGITSNVWADTPVYSGTVYTFVGNTSGTDLAFSILQYDNNGETATIQGANNAWGDIKTAIATPPADTDRNTLKLGEGYAKGLTYTFNPIAVAGFIVDASGYSITTGSTGGNRNVEIGNTTATKAYTTINYDFSITNHERSDAYIKLLGTQEWNIASSATLTLNAGSASSVILADGGETTQNGGTVDFSGDSVTGTGSYIVNSGALKNATFSSGTLKLGATATYSAVVMGAGSTLDISDHSLSSTDAMLVSDSITLTDGMSVKMSGVTNGTTVALYDQTLNSLTFHVDGKELSAGRSDISQINGVFTFNTIGYRYADMVWVGGEGTWNKTSTNWNSATAGNGVSFADQDSVTFDSSAVVTVDGNQTVREMTVTGANTELLLKRSNNGCVTGAVTVTDGATLIIGSETGRVGFVRGDIEVANGTLQFDAKDVTGYDGGANSTQNIKIAANSKLFLNHNINDNNNETFAGDIILNGTMKGVSASGSARWDLFGGSASLSVEAGNAATLDNVVLQLRQNDSEITVAADATLTLEKGMNKGAEGNGKFKKLGSGALNIEGKIEVSGISVNGGSVAFSAGGSTGEISMNANNTSLLFSAAADATAEAPTTYTVGDISTTTDDWFNRNITVDEKVVVNAASLANNWGMGTLQVNGVLNFTGELKLYTGGNTMGEKNIISGTGSVTTATLTTGNVGAYTLSVKNLTATSSTIGKHTQVTGGEANMGALTLSGKLEANGGKVVISSTSGNGTLTGTAGSIELNAGTHTVGTLDMSVGGSSTSVVTLKENAKMTVTGPIWGVSTASMNLEKDATLTHGAATIKGLSSEANQLATLKAIEPETRPQNFGGYQYSIGSESFTLTNGQFTLTSNVSNGYTDLNNKLRNVALVNEATGVLIVRLIDADRDIASINAKKGNVNLTNMQGIESLVSLDIADTMAVGAHTGYNGIGSTATDFGTISVTESVTLGSGAVVNGNLQLGSVAVKLTTVTTDSSATGNLAEIQGKLLLTLADTPSLTLDTNTMQAIAALGEGETLYILKAGEVDWGTSSAALLADDTAITTPTEIDAALYIAGLNNGYNLNYDTTSGLMGITMSIPEPTTATLSLLALAGLAARRRRK